MIPERPLRVLIGATEIARQVHDLAAGFRKLGHHTTTVVPTQNRFYEDVRYDVTSLAPLPAWLSSSNSTLVRGSRAMYRRLYAAWRKSRLLPPWSDFDLYIFQFGISLWTGNRDYRLIKSSGRALVCLFLGSDIRHWSATEPARAAAGMASYDAYRDGRSLESKMRPLRMAERYADALLFQPSYGELAIRPYNHLYLAIDLDRYQFRVPDREVPRLVHAPSNRCLKGTSEILRCFDQLRREGLQFEVRLLENLPNREVQHQLTNADVVVDELNESNYGMLSLEGMASGCAVAAGNRPDLVPLPFDRPVVHISPETLAQQLRRLIRDRSWRIQLAHRGRTFVKQHHEAANVAQHLLNLILQGGPPDYLPTFFLKQYQLPREERISRRLRKLTRDIVRLYGIPEDVAIEHVVERGLMEPLPQNRSVPRWRSQPDFDS